FQPFLAGSLHDTFLRLPDSPVAFLRQIIDEARLPRRGGPIRTRPEVREVPAEHELTLIAGRFEEKVNGVNRPPEPSSEENSKPAPLRQILAAIPFLQHNTRRENDGGEAATIIDPIYVKGRNAN